MRTDKAVGVIKVKSVSYHGKADVFNMEVEDTHDFVIQGGVIAHNCADEARYFCMSRPVSARAPKIPDEHYKNPLNMYLDIKKEDLTPPRAIERMEIISEED